LNGSRKTTILIYSIEQKKHRYEMKHRDSEEIRNVLRFTLLTQRHEWSS